MVCFYWLKSTPLALILAFYFLTDCLLFRSQRGLLAAIAAHDEVYIRTSGETKIIPGHGPLSNRAELEAYRQMPGDRRVRTCDRKRPHLEQFLTIVYQSLAD